jgi:N utilization substance protein B
MVSSRRLAREWALKILYQIDVGKPSPQEALETAQEQLRREFVHRGSRTASGSEAEATCLEFATLVLRDTLSALRAPQERAFALFLGRLLAEAPYWQELRLERAFRGRGAGISLQPPHLLTPVPGSFLMPTETDPADGLAVQIAALTPAERDRFLAFARQAQEELPNLLSPQMRKAALAFAKELIAGLPPTAPPSTKTDYLRVRREEYNRAAAEHWSKVAAMVQKQLGDWLRTAAFVHKLVTGVLAQRDSLDRRLVGLASGWSLERQVAVDRNIMRLAAYEMLFVPGIPAGVSINEAVELAKKYSTAESGRFVNGVLGALAAGLGEKLVSATATEDAIEADEQDETVDLIDMDDLEEDATG